ncbi:MAG: vanadium-dependent haloperoxidase, partial [Saprospiraceae bacterium]
TKEFYYNWKVKSLDSGGKVIPGKWYPTNDNPDGGMFPFGGRMRTFATNESQKLCPPPLAYSESKTSPYYAQALEVYTLSNPTMKYEDRWVSEFWSDDIFGQTFGPPARLFAIMDQVMVTDKVNLQTAVECAAKLGLAANDFAVACWHSKYVYDIERPENYIKRLVDPVWEPILQNTVTGVKGVTPSFPSYPSGHSTFGGGGGTILADIFGQNHEFTDLCHKDRTEFLGTPRTYASFEDAGYENALSRVTLGVHFRMDCLAGVVLGQGIARRVIKLPWKK